MDKIRIRGARTHNLKNVNVELPRGQLTVVTGLSGSGKSSLAFDTLYAEGQRRYVESLSAYARQFLSLMEKPDVDSIEGLSPAIAIEQKASSHNPRSTIGTVTEIHDYLRLLFARAGTPRCPHHGLALDAQTVSQMVDAVLERPGEERVMLLAPIVRARKGDYGDLLSELKSRGFIRARIDGKVRELDPLPRLGANQAHTIEVVVDRFRTRPELATRLAESFETALDLADGTALIASIDDPSAPVLTFSSRHACPTCGWSIPELEPRLFSFNNPAGACPTCGGIGRESYFDPERIVSQPSLSLAGGAIRGWDRRNPYYYRLIESLARHYDFDPQTPWAELPRKVRRILLYGSGEEDIAFDYVSGRGRTEQRRHPFEGVLNVLERRFRETDSQAVRDELARYRSSRACQSCDGTRLNEMARNVFIADTALTEISQRDIDSVWRFFSNLDLPGRRGEIARRIQRELHARLGFLVDVGLGYLTLARSTESLSGGEAQRIRLASQIGSGLTGVMYVLDEPSIGLHQRDNRRLIDTLVRLRDLDNTVIVVEHDEEAMRSADYLVDMGPGAGAHGGEVVAAGTPAEIVEHADSLTADYLAGRRSIPVPQARRHPRPGEVLTIRDAHGNNLKHIDVEIPLGLLTCVTGVSGSGKSTLVLDTLQAAGERALNKANTDPAPHGAIEGLEALDKVIAIDQSPIGRTPRSNPGTYTGLFDEIRKLYAELPESKVRGYKPGRFSFNVHGGRCEACQGQGQLRIEMQFLPDVYVPCDVCHGSRFNRETLQVKFKGHNIADVLDMTVEQALEVFSAFPKMMSKLQLLDEVGLGYIRIGQPAPTLSGGEAQRVKLAKELSKRATGRTLYVLDEPSVGLHAADVHKLVEVLQRLVDTGNSVLIIEHNVDIIKTADWIIDLGPEGGDRGGEVIAEGTPEELCNAKGSYTGEFLCAHLKRQ